MPLSRNRMFQACAVPVTGRSHSTPTEGRSPAVARVLRQWLERRFGPEWEQRLEDAAALRNRLRAKGAQPAEITAATAALLAPHLGES